MHFQTLIKTIGMVSGFWALAFAQTSATLPVPTFGGNSLKEFAPGQVIVKFKDNQAVGSVADILVEDGINLSTISGNRHLDELFQKHNIRKISKVFRDLSYRRTIGKRRMNRHIADSLHNEEMSALNRRNAFSGAPKKPFMGNVYVANVTSTLSIPEIAEELARDDAIEYALPNYLVESDMVPSDTLYTHQWAHKQTEAQEGWDIQTGSESVVVAVIDAGVDYTHPDLAANIWHDSAGNPGYDCVDIDTTLYKQNNFTLYTGEDYTDVDTDPMDFNGHGTHCAGIIGAAANNLTGIAGVAHHCKIMPVRAGFQHTGRSSFEMDDIVRAIRYAADNGADVISMSFGGSEPNPLEKEALDYASSMGVILVASAGNDALDMKKYPAAFDNVIAVAAINMDKKLANYSNYGYWVDIAAPGGESSKNDSTKIISTVPLHGGLNTDASGYKYLAGTSMACPYVSGLAALLKSQYPNATPAAIRGKIMSSAQPVHGKVYDYAKVGAGCVNVHNALLSQDQPYCIIRDVTISDVNGLELQVCKPQSTVKMVLEVENISTDANNVNMTIEMSSSGLSASYAAFDFGPMVTGEKKNSGENALTISVPAIADYEKTFEFTVTLNFDGYSVSRTLFLVAAENYSIINDMGSYAAGHDISGHRIVFSAYNNEDQIPNTRCYDILTESTADITRYTETSLSKYSILPRISMHNVVWTALRSEGFFNYDIYAFNMLSNTAIAVDESTGLKYSPEIYGNTIVYEHLENTLDTLYDFNISRYDLTTGLRDIVCSHTGIQSNAAVYGNTIVWEDNRAAKSNNDIFLFNGNTEYQITSDTSNQSNPKISGNYIVWADKRSGNSDIYLYDIASGSERPLCTAPGEQTLPEICGTRIVWTDYRNGVENPDIYMFDLETNQETAVTSAPWQQVAPRISESHICWLESINGKVSVRYKDINHKYIGDVTGDKVVNLKDAFYTLRFVENSLEFNETAWENADVSVDGYVSIHDFRLIAEYCVGNIPEVERALIVGDINGDHKVDFNDNMLLQAVVYQGGTLNIVQQIASDLNGDQQVDAVDAGLMEQYCNNVIDDFPYIRK